MNTESCDCRKVADYDAMELPGDFYFEPVGGLGGDTCIHLFLPDRCFICLPIARDPSKAEKGELPVWGWDGNEEKPTLTPSIDTKDHWHGWLRAGRLVSC
jgi:hypothetical protein